MSKVLFLGANAGDTTRLRLGAEAREIQRALHDAGVGEVFHVITELAVRPSDLQSLLLTHAPAVIHFSGHGSDPSGGTFAVSAAGTTREFIPADNAGPVFDERSRGGLLLEGEQGTSVVLRPDLLTTLLAIEVHDMSLRCVVLNACFTAFQAEAIAAYVDCVVGTTQAIEDEAAIAFATAFYRAIAHGKSVGTAFELGRIEIGLRGLPGEHVPQLFYRPGIKPENVFVGDVVPVKGSCNDRPAPKPRLWSPHWAHVLEPAKYFQGRKRLREELGAWLAKSGDATRVVAICAIGGTGKTALVDRVVRDWLDRTGKDGQTPSCGVFVWSFYENDRVDDFLGEACHYFIGTTGEIGGRSARLSAALKDGQPHLMVLDGLETVQADEGTGRVQGEILDVGFRGLIRQIAAAQLGQTRLLVTSRFPLCDVASWDGGGYRQVELADLEPGAARAVLKAWGVRGTDNVLDALSQEVGWHALSVRVMGAFLKNYADGDGAEGLGLDLDVMAHEASEADKKAAKLDKLLGHLSTKMPATERELMARLSFFHRGIGVELLAALVDAGGEIAGVLAGANQARLQLLLRKLVEHGLAFSYGEGSHRVYTAHPFLRDYFKKLVGVKPEDVHEVLRRRLAPSLENRPGEPPRDTETLDRYETLIEHTRLAGKVLEAFDLYWYEMGNAENVAKQIGEYRRGKRILEAFSPDRSPARCAPELRGQHRSLLVDNWGTFNRYLGDLVLAKRCFEEAVDMVRLDPHERIISHGLRNVARVELDGGHLSAIKRRAEEALHWAKSSDDSVGIEVGHSYLATAAFLTGEIPSARKHFAEAMRVDDKPLHSYVGVLQIQFRLRLGDRAGALEQSRQNLTTCERNGWRHVVGLLYTLLGHLVFPDARCEARRYLVLARDWTARTGHMEVILRAHLLAAAIEQETHPDLAHAEASEGLLLADTHGFGLYAIDLLLSLARIEIYVKNSIEAIGHAKLALARSTDPECGYAWGEADALHLLGLAHHALGERDTARDRFQQAAEIRTRIEHPEAQDSLARAAALR